MSVLLPRTAIHTRPRGSTKMPHRGNLARCVRASSAAWALSSGMAFPHLLRASPFPQHRPGEPGRCGNHLAVWDALREPAGIHDATDADTATDGRTPRPATAADIGPAAWACQQAAGRAGCLPPNRPRDALAGTH